MNRQDAKNWMVWKCCCKRGVQDPGRFAMTSSILDSPAMAWGDGARRSGVEPGDAAARPGRGRDRAWQGRRRDYALASCSTSTAGQAIWTRSTSSRMRLRKFAVSFNRSPRRCPACKLSSICPVWLG